MSVGLTDEQWGRVRMHAVLVRDAARSALEARWMDRRAAVEDAAILADRLYETIEMIERQLEGGEYETLK